MVMIYQLTLFDQSIFGNHHLVLITLSGDVMETNPAVDWEGWTGHWSNYRTHTHSVTDASQNWVEYAMCKENIWRQSSNP